MFGEDKNSFLEEKRYVIPGICSICLLLLFVTAGGEEGEISAGAVSVPEVAGNVQPAKADHRILGAEKAAQNERLADPFSPAHLTRDETEQAGRAAEEQMKRQAAAVREIPEVPVIPRGETAGKSRTVEKDREIVLQGIVHGEHGAMAIFRQGSGSVSLCVGEKLGERILTEIRREEVLFDNGEHMSLKVPETGEKINGEESK